MSTIGQIMALFVGIEVALFSLGFILGRLTRRTR